MKLFLQLFYFTFSIEINKYAPSTGLFSGKTKQFESFKGNYYFVLKDPNTY